MFTNTLFQLEEDVKFEFSKARSISNEPALSVTFPDGTKNLLDLEPVGSKSGARSVTNCRYFGKLRNDSQSSAAVTGCLNKPGDKMEITLISDHSKNNIFSLDFDGKTEVLKNPFEGLGNAFLQIKNCLTLSSLTT